MFFALDDRPAVNSSRQLKSNSDVKLTRIPKVFFSARTTYARLTTFPILIASFAIGAAILSSGCGSSEASQLTALRRTQKVASLAAVSCSSSSLASPGTDSCNLKLTQVAPEGGSTINLASSKTGVVVPTSVLVPKGSLGAAFGVSVASGLPSEAVTLTATYKQVSKTVQLNVAASAPVSALSSISCNNSSLPSPGSGSCVVQLTGAAPTSGLSVQLNSNTAGVSVPASVIVPAGSTSAAFAVNASSGLPTEVATLTAAYNQVSKSVQVQIQASAPAITVAVSPASVSLQTDATQQFVASVSGATNTAVSWKVTGAGCTGSACGAITSTGLYTAPATAPSPSSITVTATSQQDTTKSASATVGITASPAPQTSGTTYYIAPNGSDSNNGLSASSPWLTPHHSVNCGDVLLAAAGIYSSGNFYNGKWGNVTCPTKNNVAWLKCATPFACSIAGNGQTAMFISAGYWGVQGFSLTSTGSAHCIFIENDYSNPVQIDHIIIANNIMGPCGYMGVSNLDAYGVTSPAGVDYVAYLGNIVHDTGGGSSNCAAGLSFYAPVATDTQPGTHWYMAGNFAWGNTSNCGDGEGIIFDTLDGKEAGWPTTTPYAYQMVAENNIAVFNNGPGIQVDLNENGVGAHAPVYFIHNTSAYNCLGPSGANYCADIVLGTTVNANSSNNLVVAPTQYAFGGSSVPHYGSAAVYAPSSTNHVSDEFAYSAYGFGVGAVGSSGFVPGPSNITSTDPQLANPVNPGTPSCSGYATTTACMATVIANFAPTNSAAKSYGYQQPSSTPVANPYYPQWLCGVSDLPNGLVTPGCA